MKTASWKKIAVPMVATGLAIAGVMYFKSVTEKKSEATFIDPAFAEYISSYTSGVIPSGSSLRIVMSTDMVDSTLVGKESGEKLFDFTPSVSGTSVWVDERTIAFKPEGRMTSGTIYTGEFFLAKVKGGLPDALRTFRFSFQIIPQNFEVVIVNTRPYVKTDLEREKIEGTFNTADYAAATDVEKTLNAEQEGKTLKVAWTHSEDGRQHSFVVDDVLRKGASGKVEISADGTPIGIDRVEQLEVEIPALSEFKLMRSRVVQSPTQHVVLQFSDPVKESQDLDGLIRIDGLESLDFDVHDNEIWVYPPVRQNGTMSLSVSRGIRNVLDQRLKAAISEQVVFEQVRPAVRFTGRGSILPGTDGMVIPFEAVNLNAVDVQITKIHEDNVLQFFQVNNLEGNQEMRRVGNRIVRKKLVLESTGITDPGKWNRYTLDISKLIQEEPGAIYEVKLGFRRTYSTYSCEGQASPAAEQFESPEDNTVDDGFAGAWSYEYYDDYYYGESFDWRQRENPCSDSYYTSEKSVSKNILASDIGLTVKRGDDGNTLVFATDLRTAEPMPGVEITLYSFQLQDLATGITDGDGKASLGSKEVPFAVAARKGTQRGYLRMINGESLLVSSFDVSGNVVHKGLKGFLYGERGVWRPGDSLFLTFILEDKRKVLPDNHPVVFELTDPRGQVMQRMVRGSSENGFYRFATVTPADAPTGNWLGKVKVGGTTFTETLKIETVKPNRLKIDLDFGTEKFISPHVDGILEVKWLHGAPGRNLKADFDVMLVRQPTRFSLFPDYNFDDPSREFESESQSFFEGSTDMDGKAIVTATLDVAGSPSGLLSAVFRGKVFEESGNFSIDRFSIPFYPYEAFVGLLLPEGERYSGILYTDVAHKVGIATVDTEGKAVSRKGIEVNMYKLQWRWWWDNSNESLANFVEGSYARLVKSGTINTVNGKGEWTFNLPAAEYGRYFIRACDPVSGHCSGQIAYVDEPGWYSRARGEDVRGGANLLSFSTDKTSYNIGEKINITIPGSAGGRALVSIENGSKVLETYWVETRDGKSPFVVEVTPDMAPNVYVHVSLLQPHAQTENDQPIRLYGVMGIQVEDPATHLEPVIAMPDVIVPGEQVVIRVSEKANRKMTYTLAVVDEGLLDLTRFKTPDAWAIFYAKEALGVRTWDLYDHVIGAFGSKLERFISIGGDDALSPGEVDPLANRFKPVVKFFGPYTLDGRSDEVKFIMPQYIGSVKTMVVAGYDGSYGKAEKVSAVRKPLMVLATLPRVLGPEEIVTLPVTLFSGEKSLQNVNVSVTAKGPVSVSGDQRKSISLTGNSDMTVDFTVAVKSATGVASIEVTATSGNLSSSDAIEIQVRNPNLPISRVEAFLLEPKAGRATPIKPFGMTGTNSAVVEVSSLPPINLGTRMRYLLQYPHGCIEQTTSSVFPQLYLDQVKALSETEKDVIQRNIKAGIEQMRSFVQSDGGFGYWPGPAESSDSWGTSYAGHFLIEAQAKGYYVPDELLSRWKNFQRSKVMEWRRNDAYFNSDLMQSYRLYTLALAGSPQPGAMNRLREESNLTPTAAWMLASAFAVAGQKEAAKKLMADLPVAVSPYRELGYTYGSPLRDKALILETLVLLDDEVRAFEILREISQALGDHGYWLSTQETAMCLKAVSAFAARHKRGDLKFQYKVNGGKTINASTGLPVAQVQIPVTETKENTVEISNSSEGLLFTRLITTGTPAQGQEQDEANQLRLSVRYTDGAGNAIDPSILEQGTEFIAEVSVTHPGLRGPYENLALSQVFPSGWEINNLRLEEAEQVPGTSPFRYQDIRDDRVLTYFDLAPGQERTFRVLLTAAYAGSYYLPAVGCEAMYEGSIYARQKGQPVSVVKAQIR